MLLVHIVLVNHNLLIVNFLYNLSNINVNIINRSGPVVLASDYNVVLNNQN